MKHFTCSQEHKADRLYVLVVPAAVRFSDSVAQESGKLKENSLSRDQTIVLIARLLYKLSYLLVSDP